MKLLPPLEPQDSMLAGMAYPFWFAISPYLLLGQKKQEPFVRFHAMQSVVVGSIATMLTLLMLIIGAFLFSTAPSVSDITRTVEQQNESETSQVNVRNDSYVTQGCFSVGLFSSMMLFVAVEFAFILYCAYKAWNGVFYSIPFVGKYIEDKYFSDFAED